METLINLDDYARAARERLDPGTLAWMEGGALDEVTLRENEAAWLRYRLRPRMLRDVSAIDLSTTLLGQASAMPIGVAPMAQHGFFTPEGELASARAAKAAGVPYVLSTRASRTIEEVAAVGGTLWFQLYVLESPGHPEELVRRAEAAGYTAIVFTVDAPILGVRERDIRAGENYPTFNYAAAPHDPHDMTLTWDDLDRIRDMTSLPVVIKGVMTGEDAAIAVEHGAAAVWASNHGGRQLDRTLAAVDVLEEIVAAVDGQAEVYVDGGVRRGIDVAIALALGARAVFLGRPVLQGLAVEGEAGARDVLAIIERELANAMALIGAASTGDIVREMVAASS
jgi:4-hydroxymandelate oxidase